MPFSSISYSLTLKLPPSITNSKFSPRLTTAYLAYISSLFMLFTHFFIQSYMGGGKKKGGKSKKN